MSPKPIPNPLVAERLAHEEAVADAAALLPWRQGDFDHFFVAFSNPSPTDIQHRLYVGERLGGLTATLVAIAELSDTEQTTFRYRIGNHLRFGYVLERYNPMSRQRTPSHVFPVPSWAGRSDLAATIFSRGVLLNWPAYRPNELELHYVQLDATDTVLDRLWVVKTREQTWEEVMQTASAVHDH